MSAVSRASMLLSLALAACTTGDTTVVPAADDADTATSGDTTVAFDGDGDATRDGDAIDATETRDETDGSETSGDTTPPPTCKDPTTFPTFGKGCTLDAHCSIVLHQLDCCGSLGAIGINHAFVDDFNATEEAYRKTCSVCDCPVMDTRTESGVSTNDPTKIAVRCDVGLCKTYVK